MLRDIVLPIFEIRNDANSAMPSSDEKIVSIKLLTKSAYLPTRPVLKKLSRLGTVRTQAEA